MALGAWSRAAQSTVLSNAYLAEVGKSKNLVPCLNGHPFNTPSASQNLISSLVQAICGAVYKDGGLSALREVMLVLGITFSVTLNTIPLSFILSKTSNNNARPSSQHVRRIIDYSQS